MMFIEFFGSSSINNLRLKIAAVVLACASIPIQLYAVPGFEFTLALILAPACLFLVDFSRKSHLAVLAFLAFCLLIASAGLSSLPRNLMGAVSYCSPVLYLFVGTTLAKKTASLSEFWKVVAPAALLTAGFLTCDYLINGGSLVISGAYETQAYRAEETTYLKSFLPFYGTFGVITFATVAMVIGAFALASAPSFNGWSRVLIIVSSNFLILTAALMSSRQVMGGILVFYLAWAAVALGWRRFLIVLAVLTLVAVAVVAFALYVSHDKAPDPSAIEYSTADIIIYKIAKSVDELRHGQFDELTTGRVTLWVSSLSQLSPRLLAMGCGFCSMADVFGFNFSTLHNVALTAAINGGVFFALSYIGLALAGLYYLARFPKGFGRDVTLATLVSLSFQSLVNDVLFFQIIPQLLFALSGFLIVHRRHHLVPPHRNLGPD